MEITIEKIDIDKNGRIIIFFNDGFSWEFPSMSALESYAQVVLNNDAIKRIIVATLLVNNQVSSTTRAKKYTLSMLGEPHLTIRDV